MGIRTIGEWCHVIRQNAIAKGFTAPEVGPEFVDVPAKLCLIHSEVSEALEAYRVDADLVRSTLGPEGKPEGFPSELADTVIRAMELAAALGIDLEAEIERKHLYNVTRPYMHGGKRV